MCITLSENLSNKNLKILKKAKTIKINVNEAIADGNSIQLPCVAEYQGERITSLEYVWDKKTKDGVVKRGITVSGHGLYGIPTLRDFDVLLGLQRVFISKKTKDGIVELKTEDIRDDDLMIDFTIHELALEIGYVSPNRTVRDNLKQSIMTLVATSIFNTHEGGIYDIKTKSYVTNQMTAYHYLESSEGYETENNDGTINDVTKIKISRFFYDMILNDYKLFYNADTYRQIKNVMAKKIYLLALQWKGKNDYTVMHMNTLIDRVPIVQDKQKYRKQYIKKALKILDDEGVVRIIYDKNDPDKVWFWFKEPEEGKGIPTYFMNEFNSYPDTIQGFMDYGFTAEETLKYIDIQKLKHIQAILRFIKVKETYESFDAKEMIIDYVINEKRVAEKYYNKG